MTWEVDEGAIIPEMGFKVCVRQKEEVQRPSPVYPNILSCMCKNSNYTQTNLLATCTLTF